MQQTDLRGITLDSGSHDTREEGMCLMELVAWLAGQEHSHLPTCTSPTLADYASFVNDHLPHAPRQRLLSIAPALVDTSCPDCEEARVNTLVETTLLDAVCPALDRLHLGPQAQALRDAVQEAQATGAGGAERARTHIAQVAARLAGQHPRTNLDDQPGTLLDHARTAAERLWGDPERPPALYEAVWAAHQATGAAVPQPWARVEMNLNILRKTIAACTHAGRPDQQR